MLLSNDQFFFLILLLSPLILSMLFGPIVHASFVHVDLFLRISDRDKMLLIRTLFPHVDFVRGRTVVVCLQERVYLCCVLSVVIGLDDSIATERVGKLGIASWFYLSYVTTRKWLCAMGEVLRIVPSSTIQNRFICLCRRRLLVIVKHGKTTLFDLLFFYFSVLPLRSFLSLELVRPIFLSRQRWHFEVVRLAIATGAIAVIKENPNAYSLGVLSLYWKKLKKSGLWFAYSVGRVDGLQIIHNDRFLLS